MAASSYGNFERTSVTHLERGILFLSYCYPERMIYDDACRLKKCCVNPVRKKKTKRLGKIDMVLRTSCSSGSMWIYGANPIATPTIEMNCME